MLTKLLALSAGMYYLLALIHIASKQDPFPFVVFFAVLMSALFIRVNWGDQEDDEPKKCSRRRP